MKKLLLTAILAATLAPFANAGEVSGTTNFKVSVPEILVLYHWDEAYLNLTGGAFSKADKRVHKLTQSIRKDQALFDMKPVNTDGFANLNPKSTIAVTLQDSWAVRSLSAGNVTMALETQKPEHLLNGDDNTSVALVKDAAIDKTDIPSQWEPTLGNITFDLDLSGVNKPGTYMTAGSRTPDSADPNDTFKLTLTGN